MKKIIWLFLFLVVYGGLAFYITTNLGNNRTDYRTGGVFLNDRYTNTSAGIEVDMTDKWVYLTGQGLENIPPKYSQRFGISDFSAEDEDGSTILIMLKPGIMTSFTKLNSPLTASELNESTMSYMLEYSKKVLRSAGAAVTGGSSGVFDTRRGIFYYSIDCYYESKSATVFYAFFNTPEAGFLYMGTSMTEDGQEIVADLLKNKVTFTAESAVNQGQAL
ncbi:MAG: hypothetical protein ACI4J7_02895 [Ruminiclostridium sp.]